MSTTPGSLQERDITYVLHPYTNAVKHREIGPIVIESGEGIHVYDATGKKYIEGMAGLWSVAVGFNEQRLVDAAARQMQKLPFYHSFTHKTHTPSIELAELLVESTHGKMSRAFFTNSGSEANDTVIKMLWYYNNALGRPQKKKIISRQRAYHGVTVASASLTGLAPNHKDFDLPIPQVRHVRCPDFYREGLPGETEVQFAERLAAELEDLILAEGADTIAGFIGEPVMGAGGVIIPPETYWERIQEVCRKHDILVIVDEVITGFGRLGKMYGSDVFGIEPDIMVLSKQITSSYLPFAAVLINKKVDDVIASHSGKLGVFGHGYTASGHPVAAAVAIENIRIIEEKGLVDNAARVGQKLQSALQELSDHPLVGQVRGMGLIAAVELVADKSTRAPFDPAGSVGTAVAARCHENGLIVRNIQDAVAFCPPLIITEQEVDDMVARFRKSLDEVAATL
ncbi:MAG TPA: aspartate aminotransferase family protein [Burkholderiaceae bacterium]|nr:aspartate aminotransferase family protein [Burkholderiaceae bacterium]